MNVRIVEEHGASLAAWGSLGRAPRTIVYLDAHLDVQPIAEPRIAALQACRSLDELRTLEKPHALSPDSAGAYGLENWIYPAHRLGLIERLIWVVPPHVGSGFSARALGQLQQMDGITLQDLQSFTRTEGGWIEGRPLGLPLTLASLDQLAQMTLPADAVIDIDIDYFIALPEDAPWIAPRQVFEALRRAVPHPALVMFSRSVSSGFTPLRYRFLADGLAAWWEGRVDDAAHAERLFELDARLRAGERAHVAEALAHECERQPHSAAAQHLLSLAVSDASLRVAAQRAAQSLCPAYGPDLLRSACEVRHRQLPLDLASVMAWQRQLQASRDEAATQALGWAALGLLHAAFGRLADARACHRRAAEHFGSHPELALAVGKLLLSGGDAPGAIPFLEEAQGDDKTRTSALVFLAQAQGRQGDFAQALALLQQASERAPAWSELLHWQARALEAADQRDEAWRAADRARALERSLHEVARQLAAHSAAV